MGTTLELTTEAWTTSHFYVITSSGFNFAVKGTGVAGIGLSNQIKSGCDYWVGFGNEACWIKGESTKKSNNSSSLLSRQVFNKYWIAWNGDNIRLGRYGEAKPIIFYANETIPNLKYIKFASISTTHSLDWQIELPPVLNIPRDNELKPINKFKPEWIASDTRLPPNPVVGGYEKEPLYIIRTRLHGALTPGKFVPSMGLGFIPWGGSSHETSDFETLCGIDYSWVRYEDGNYPLNAVVGGRSEDGETLYVGRAEYNGRVIPGKVQPSHGCCYIAYREQEVSEKKYEVLISPSINSRCVNSELRHNGLDFFNVNVYSDEEFDE